MEMTKEQEALKRIETTFSMNKQGKESVYREYTNSVYPYYEDFDLVLNALKRLESIDNANPSEALECLEALEQDIKDRVILAEDRQLKLCTVIKQALLKAQEPKQYLKWEDLEFKEERQKQIIKVKKNDNLYILKYYISVFNEELIEILANDWTFITGLSNRKYDKQFFNDLHLERVE